MERSRKEWRSFKMDTIMEGSKNFALSNESFSKNNNEKKNSNNSYKRT